MMRAEVGQHIEWDRQTTGVMGVIVELPKATDYDVDQLMGRNPGESEREFGRLAGVRCTDLACHCNRTDWLHSVNESQMRAPTEPVVQVALW